MAVPKAYANRVSPASTQLGLELARLTDAAEIDALKKFPDHARRCKSCAFTAGTIPNQCADTLLDAIKCVVEHKPFMCHEVVDGEVGKKLCAGWAYAEHATCDKPAGSVPWDFSKP